MIDLYFWATPNGQKISIALEEFGLPYNVHTVDITKGEQQQPAFVAVSPNGRIPAIVDHAPADGGPPLSVFESGAILQYLGDKTGKFFPKGPRARAVVNEWLMWQMGGVGPMTGQAFHFAVFANEKIPYAIGRYTNEVKRLYGVLDRRLEGREYVADDFSIADMSLYAWVAAGKRLDIDHAAFPNMTAWLDRMAARPGVQRGMAVGA